MATMSYQFKLAGHINERWFCDLPHFTVNHKDDGTTILIAKVADQAALYGVIMRLRDAGVALLALKQTNSADY